MKSTTADNATVIFEDHEIAHIFADFRQRSRQQCAVSRVGRDQVVDTFRVRKAGFTRAHGLPPACVPLSVWLPRAPAELARVRCLLGHRGFLAPTADPGRNKNPDRIWNSPDAILPGSDPQAHGFSRYRSVQLCQFARAPAG